ncbi:MAG: glucans biosynthesis glucosyltransferase MdoH [Xanthobacteraceae bacterium]|nr:glucans biosynthesis glucosyltransferase MdoH [Xanthobacteraceae bacterium]
MSGEQTIAIESSAGGSRELAARRALFAFLVIATIAGTLALAAYALSAGGFGVLDVLLLISFGLTLPWTCIGFWNAVIGFCIMRFSHDPIAAVVPAVAHIRPDEPITASTAICMFVRNEPPDRVIRNLDAMLREIDAAGVGQRFHLYVLSDTSRDDIATLEDAGFAVLAERWRGRIPVTYRRRTANTGFKAGNFWDFCERFGGQHEFAVTLDTDSFMTAAAIMRLVRIIQADPKLGILQGLVVGLPSASAFARLFQFGMRLGMRSWTIGSAWWQADCGPYWGHNAVIRIAPFVAHCHIPKLPGEGVLDGHVLSHDQIEAAFMRRAGYHVRVLPEEDLGWEQNPPTLIEFLRRDQRWCQGNLQYWPFIKMPDLPPVCRFQLLFAMLMFIGSPAWMGMLIFGTIAAALAPTPADFMHAGAGHALLVLVFVMWFAPHFATELDVLFTPALRRAFGGLLRFLAGMVVMLAFYVLILPTMWFCHTLFMIEILLFGRAIGWAGQVRDDHTVSWAEAGKQLWPHAALGWGAIVLLALTHPSGIPYALLLAGGPALAIPLAVVSAWPAVGRALVRLGIGRLPEETTPPPALTALALPALAKAEARPA